MNYTRVTERANRIAVIGSGSSLRGKRLEFPDYVTVIAVNGAISFLDRVDYWFTLDHSKANLELERLPMLGVTYYHAAPPDFKETYPWVKYLQRITGSEFGRFKCKGGLPRDTRLIHTGNSGWGAFQLACHMKPSKVALFGFDGAGEYRYGGHPKVLTMMPWLFQSSVSDVYQRGIEVCNASMNSTITCFQKLTVKEGIEWVAG